MNRKIVFVIGETNTPSARITLRAFQSKLNNAGVPTRNILDFAPEGEEAPSFVQMSEMKEFIDKGTSTMIVFGAKCTMCIELMMYAREREVEFIGYDEIDWNTFPDTYKKKNWWQKLDDILRPWFTNPMKAQQANH